jgi:hypothetical protein
MDVTAILDTAAVAVQHPALMFDLAGAMYPQGPTGMLARPAPRRCCQVDQHTVAHCYADEIPLSHVSFATPVDGATAVSFVAATDFIDHASDVGVHPGRLSAADETFSRGHNSRSHNAAMPNVVSVGTLDLATSTCSMPSTDPRLTQRLTVPGVPSACHVAHGSVVITATCYIQSRGASRRPAGRGRARPGDAGAAA